MVKIALQIKAVLENLTKLRPEGDDFRWYVKVKCANCGEVTNRFVYLCLEETTPMKGSRGSANLVIKCHLCGRDNSMDILPDSIGSYNIENDGKFVTMVVFDCRGVEPVDFQPTVGFIAESSESGMEFREVSFAEGDWTDYDENASVSVGVYELQHKFIKA